MPFGAELLRYLPQLINVGGQVAGAVLTPRAQSGAIQQAGQISQAATNDAMRAIMGLYDQGQAKLSPYANVGGPALDRLQQLVGRTPVSAGMPTGNMMASTLGGSTGGGYAGQQAVASAGRTTAAGKNPMQQAASSSAKNSLLGGAAGAAGTVGAGLASGAMLGAGPGFGLGLGLSALGGPIGIGAGLLGSFIGSRFGRNNPYKEAASKGIDEVSRQIWGTNTPGIPANQLQSGVVADVMQGRKNVQQGRDEVNGLMNAWIETMKEQGTPDSVLQKSIQTQMQYLQPVKDLFARMSGGQQQPALGG